MVKRHNLEHNSIACVREEVRTCRISDDDAVKNDTNRPNQLPEISSVYRTLSGTETLYEQGRHLIRVPTIAPILNRRWFLEQIETILRDKIMSSI